MPYHLELGSNGHRFPEGKAIVVNTLTGQHYSAEPIPIANARKQLNFLQSLPERHGKKETLKVNERSYDPSPKEQIEDVFLEKMTKMKYRGLGTDKGHKLEERPISEKYRGFDTERPAYVDEAKEYRAKILSLSLFPNLYNRHMVMTSYPD